MNDYSLDTLRRQLDLEKDRYDGYCEDAVYHENMMVLRKKQCIEVRTYMNELLEAIEKLETVPEG